MSQAEIMSHIKQLAEGVLASGDQEYIAITLPGIVELFVKTVGVYEDKHPAKPKADNLREMTVSRDYLYFMRLLDLAIAHHEGGDPPDPDIAMTGYVGRERKGGGEAPT